MIIDMHVNTINQYLVLQFIKKNFDIHQIVVEIYDSNSLKIIDEEGSTGIFTWNPEKKMWITR